MTEKLRWTPTVHATQRLKERFNISPESARNYVNQIMTQAKYMHAGKGDKLVYYYEKRDMMIVVNPDEGVIVTVHEGTEPTKNTPVLTVSRIAKAVQREFNRMKTQLSREVRKLSEQQAHLNVQIAELSLNKIRCYHPPTQALIQSRIDAFSTQVNELASEIEAKLAQLKTAETEVKAVVGE